jgi:hypothetical protein
MSERTAHRTYNDYHSHVAEVATDLGNVYYVTVTYRNVRVNDIPRTAHTPADAMRKAAGIIESHMCEVKVS